MVLERLTPALKSTGYLPNLVIIGAMKGGTSSLHHYLSLHPQIWMSGVKELDFFIEEKNWNQGCDWYQSHFSSTEIRGESSPNYSKAHVFKGVPQRMAGIIPDAKLIYILRDPIKRILSHYLHQYISRHEFGDLATALSAADNHYIQCSRYAMQLEQFLPYYSLSQILVLSLEELAGNHLATLHRVFEFLGVNACFTHPGFDQVAHLSSDKRRLNDFGAQLVKLPVGRRIQRRFLKWTEAAVEPPLLDEAMRQSLLESLQPDVQRLRALTGESFRQWSL